MKSTEEVFNRKSALGSYINWLCEALSDSNIQVYLNGASFKALSEKYNVETTNNSASIGSQYSRYFPEFGKKFLKDLLIFKRNKSLVENCIKLKYDAVLEFYSYASTVGYEVSHHYRIPLIVVYDAPILEEYQFFNGKKLIFKNKIHRREIDTLKSASRVVVYSKPVAKYISKQVSVISQISFHQNIDFSRIHFVDRNYPDGELNIGFIGSFLPWHRVDWLVSSFIKLRSEGHPLNLYLIGDGMEYKKIENIVKNSLYKENIHLTGFLDGAELEKIKQILHIGVMPGSNWYGAPNKVFEYGAAGMAVVAPDTPTIQDIFDDDQDIFLFDQSSQLSLFQKLKDIVINRDRLVRVSRNLKSKIQKQYSTNITREFYKSIIEDSICVIKNR